MLVDGPKYDISQQGDSMSKSLFTALAVLVLSISALASKPIQLIVGGENASEGEFPFIVSLQSGSHFCGGSLISDEWVLTAAHCVGGSNIKIVTGLYNQKILTGTESFRSARVIPHPQYNRSNMDYDFALIQLDGKSTSKAITLNENEINIPTDSTIVESITAGWGYTREGSWKLSDILQKVTVPLISKETCMKSYSGVTDQMICAGLPQGGKDSCQGDSGGPLVVFDYIKNETVLAGVVSWGEGCARPNKFGVYSKVNSVIDWINKTAR